MSDEKIIPDPELAANFLHQMEETAKLKMIITAVENDEEGITLDADISFATTKGEPIDAIKISLIQLASQVLHNYALDVTKGFAKKEAKKSKIEIVK